MSWKRIKLGELLTESKIESIKSDPDKRITVRLNLKGIEKRPYERGVEGATKYFIRKAGQFIYGKQNLFKGAFGIIPKELDGYESSSDIPAFDIDNKCLPEWLMFYLRQGNFYLSLESIATGTGSRRIQPTRLFEIEIPLPSIKEQQKIIDDCNFIEKKYCQISDELILQESYIQQLRQSILQEAVQGKLSEQNPSDENAATLLKRIKAEKQKLIKEGKLKKEKELPPITQEEGPFELPKGWVWCRLGEVIELISGQHVEAADWNDKRDGYPYLTGPSDFGDINPIFSRWTKKPKVFAMKDDILITVKGSGVGKLNVLHENNIAIGRQLMAVRVRFVERRMVSLFLDANFIAFQNDKAGIAIPGISREDILNKIFALPSLAEQQRIVAKVQQLQQQLNQLESQVQQSREYAEQLLQAVLKEAFEEKGTVYEENEMVSMAAEE